MPVINIEGMIKLENHQFATPNVKANSSKNHQCMLRPLGKKLLKTEYSHGAKVLTSQITQQHKGENVSLKWKPGCHHLKSLNLMLLIIGGQPDII